jgi:anti-repressor protein
MNNLVNNLGAQTMSSREMAELTETRHDSVKRTIETLRDKGVIQSPQIVNFNNINGVVGVEYLVCKRDSYIIVAQLSPEMTAKLVDRWQELEAQQSFKIPQTLSGALMLAAQQAEQLEQLQLQVTNDAPKVEFAMAVRRMEGSCQIGEFCKALGIGRTTFFKLLRADKVLQENNLPYQRYIDGELFVVSEQVPYTDSKGKSHPTFTTMVTGKGQVWLERKYRVSAPERRAA